MLSFKQVVDGDGLAGGDGVVGGDAQQDGGGAVDVGGGAGIGIFGRVGVEDLFQHDAVAAAVAADAFGHFDFVGCAVHGKDIDVFAAEVVQLVGGFGQGLLLAGDECAADGFDGFDFDAAAVAGDGGAVALPGAVGEQGVAERMMPLR